MNSGTQYGYEELKKLFEHEQRYRGGEEDVPLRFLDQLRRARGTAPRPKRRRPRPFPRSMAV